MFTQCVAIVPFNSTLILSRPLTFGASHSHVFVYCTFADVPPGVLDGGIAVDVGEQAEAEPVAVVGGIREAVDEHAGGGSLERLADAIVELVINN